ncbi:MAG: hypothetical protein RIS52_34 [Pseudomonadota bacterium]|jgi:hypothetical protein
MGRYDENKETTMVFVTRVASVLVGLMSVGILTGIVVGA